MIPLLICITVLVTVTSGYRQHNLVLIYDTLGIGLNDYFTNMIQLPENRYRMRSKKLNIENRKQTCAVILNNSVSYHLVENDHDGVSKVDYSTAESNQIDSTDDDVLEETFNPDEYDPIYNPSLEIEINLEVFHIPAHICTTKSQAEGKVQFAVTNGHHRKVILLLKKTSENSNYKVSALVEPIPSFNTQFLKRQDLETAYLTGHVQLDSSDEDGMRIVKEPSKDDIEERSYEEEKHRRSICDLDEFQKYRLCATAYTAWAQFENETYRKVNYMIRSGNFCMKKATILFGPEAGVKSIGADLIPCSINKKDFSHPQIFVTNDQYRKDSAFILKAVYGSDNSDYSHSLDGDILGYNLLLHLHNVSSLKTFKDEE